MRFLLAATIHCAALTVAAPAFAQAWPVKPVRVIVPFAPGGTADTLGRMVAGKLGERFGQSFVIDNRPGAGGAPGLDIVARAAPDGYTLGVSGIGPLVVATALAAKPPYDPLKDFTHIALFGGPPSALAVNAASPAKTLQEFIAAAKSSPATYGTAGNGSTGNLLAEHFRRVAGIELVHVPYKGASGAVLDLLAGNIQAISATLSTAAGPIRAGRIRILALSSAERLPDFPDAPTFAELGYPELTASVWFSLSGPAGLPQPLVARLNAEVRQALQQPDVRARLRSEDIQPGTLDAGAFSEFVATEIRRWTPLARASGVKSE